MRANIRCLQRLSLNISTIAILIVVTVLILYLSGSPYMTKVMAAEGIALGAYWDPDCLSSVSGISWGLLVPGSFKDVKIYLRNEGGVAFRLVLNAINWDPPEASKHINLSWDYDGRILIPHNVLRVVLRLSLSPNIEGMTTFSFDILINCEEVSSATEQPPPPPPPPKVDDAPPKISITSPKQVDVITSSSLVLQWTGWDSESGISYYSVYLDEEFITNTEDTSYELHTRNLDDGYHMIRIVATDKAGNMNSSSIHFVVDNSNPVVSIISPSEDAVVSGSLTIRLVVFDINLVDIVYKFDGKPMNATESILGETTYKIDTTKLDDGPHTIDFIAIDAAGNSVEKRIRINVDNTPPILEMKAPANGSYVKGLVSINLVCEDANLERADLYISNNMTKRWHISGTQMFNWNTGIYEDGTYVIKALATDKAGNIVEKALMVSVDNTMPELLITSPREGSKLAGTQTIRFAASDGNLAKVLLYIDDLVIDVTRQNSYEWYTASLNDGIHRIKIVATDEAGNINEAQITVTTINKYLIIETLVGLVICVFLIATRPLILASKVPIM